MAGTNVLWRVDQADCPRTSKASSLTHLSRILIFFAVSVCLPTCHSLSLTTWHFILQDLSMWLRLLAAWQLGYLYLLYSSWLPWIKTWKMLDHFMVTPATGTASLLCQSQLLKTDTRPSFIQGGEEGLHCLMEEWQFHIVEKYWDRRYFSSHLWKVKSATFVLKNLQ